MESTPAFCFIPTVRTSRLRWVLFGSSAGLPQRRRARRSEVLALIRAGNEFWGSEATASQYGRSSSASHVSRDARLVAAAVRASRSLTIPQSLSSVPCDFFRRLRSSASSDSARWRRPSSLSSSALLDGDGAGLQAGPIDDGMPWIAASNAAAAIEETEGRDRAAGAGAGEGGADPKVKRLDVAPRLVRSMPTTKPTTISVRRDRRRLDPTVAASTPRAFDAPVDDLRSGA